MTKFSMLTADSLRTKPSLSYYSELVCPVFNEPPEPKLFLSAEMSARAIFNDKYWCVRVAIDLHPIIRWPGIERFSYVYVANECDVPQS